MTSNASTAPPIALPSAGVPNSRVFGAILCIAGVPASEVATNQVVLVRQTSGGSRWWVCTWSLTPPPSSDEADWIFLAVEPGEAAAKSGWLHLKGRDMDDVQLGAVVVHLTDLQQSKLSGRLNLGVLRSAKPLALKEAVLVRKEMKWKL